MRLKTWKNCSQKLLIMGEKLFFQYCQPAQNQPKFHFLFHKNATLREGYYSNPILGSRNLNNNLDLSTSISRVLIARLIENFKKHHILFLFSNPCGQNLCIEISVLSFWCWTYVYIVWLKGTFCLLYWHRKQPLKKAKHKGGSFCVKLLLYVQGIPVFHDFCFKKCWDYEFQAHCFFTNLNIKSKGNF